jgi:hypothetical protein
VTSRTVVVCLLLFLLAFGGLGCHDDGADPVDVAVHFYGDPPSEYDCSSQSRFVVALWPENRLDLVGDYLQMYFQLKKDGTAFYISNDIEFPLSTDSVYYLEFGGAIEGALYREYYDMVATVRVNGQTSITASSEARSIHVTEKTAFGKTMHIEYDCQEDCGFTETTFAKLTAAFHVADTDTDFRRDELDLPEEWIWWDSLGLYHWRHFSNTAPYNMHILAVQGLEENSKEITTGASRPGPDGYSYVFVGDIWDYHEENASVVIAKTNIHELGHQRAHLTHASGDNPHPENHDSPFCAMNQDILYEGDNDNDPDNDPTGLKRYFCRNPHFCDMCVTTIRNVSW